MDAPKASRDAMAAVGGLADVISQPDLRERFLADPEATLKGAGVAAEHIPREVLDHLSGLSSDELAFLAKLSDRLVESGFYFELPGGGKVCFF